jgi:Flp pilus assembly protein TadB
MGFFIGILVIWAIFMVVWFLVSKYVKSSDMQRIKDRLSGTSKAKQQKLAKQKKGPQSVIQGQDTVPNKLAQILVDKYKLGPKILEFLEQAGLKWSPARLVHLCLVCAASTFAGAWVHQEIGRAHV